jgi:hypothetical protein
MKIGVLIASRNRPMRLGIALQRIAATAVNLDDVHVAVWLDDDDPSQSQDVVNAFTGCRVTLMFGPRPQSLGSVFNVLCKAVHADLYTVLADDVYPAQRGWDEVMRRLHAQFRQPVYCWRHRCADPAYPILSREWINAAGGIFTADLFPYWFDDIWLAEVVEMVTGETVACVEPLKLTGDKGTGTPRMRDLRWWYRVFHSTRPIRLKQAEAIHAALYGSPLPDRSSIVASMQAEDDRRESSADRWETEYSTATGEPDAAYIAAKVKAEKLCQDQGLW